MNVRRGLRTGLLTGAICVFLVLLGITELFGDMLADWFDLQSLAPGAWLVLVAISMWSGTRAGRDTLENDSRGALVAGLFAGLANGLMLGLMVGIWSALTYAGADVRSWLAKLTPDALELLTFGLDPLPAAILMFGVLTLMGVAGVVLAQMARRYRWREAVRQRAGSVRTAVQAAPAAQRFAAYPYSRQVLIGLGVTLLLVAPLLLGRYWNYTLGTVGIYVMLGLGLNIVVGLAGLLDLGYVAFFAIGAYSVALLTAPEPHGIQMSFWLALPLAVAITAASGVLLGVPVLRMRGDYLAIVTLGFGEIIRILSKSDALTSFTGGPRGVRDIGGPSVFGFDINSEFWFMYLIMLGIVLVAFVTNRLQYARVGRAWMAMREDEDVASAMGVHTLRYKLLAFAIGAAFAGLGGGIYASRNQFTGPEDFTLIVSINVLCLVIIGGMGSIPGVILGALVLKGLPEVLRELDDYRVLAFGALLVFMMIVRPEGLWPSQRRRMELHEYDEEVLAMGAEAAPGGSP